MNWAKRDLRGPSIFSYLFTLLFFCCGIAIAVVTTPFVQYYFYTGSFPDSDQTKQIFSNLGDDLWGVVLSSVTGIVFLLITMVAFKFGKFFSTLITLIEFYALYYSAQLITSWLMWKYNPTTNVTLLTMLPFVVQQFCVFIVLEIGAIFGQGGRVVYGFVGLAYVLGAFAGALRSIDQEYFYFGQSADPFASTTELGAAFGVSVIDTVFLVGASALTGVCVARSKSGGTGFWHVVAFLIPVGLACAFSMYVELAGYIPKIESDVARYILGSVIAVITLLTAVFLFNPLRKLADPSKNKQVAYETVARVGGPMAANAVVVV